ncbi:MAG: CdaR family protein [Candidatus Binatia bacterium]
MKHAWEKFISLASSDLGLKLFSLGFALGLWLFVNVGQKPAEWPFKVPIEFRNIPSDVIVSNPGLDQIEVRVMGPPALLSTINADQLKVVLDLDGARPGTSTFRLGPDYFNPPRGVRITRISPSAVHLKLELVAVRSLPVSVRFEGEPPFGYKVKRVEVNPETVRVRGPAQEVNRMASVETELLEYDSARGPKAREVRLASAGKPLSFSPDRVTVLVALEEEWMTREFSGVEVKAKDFAGEYSVSPRRVTLRLSGPKRILGRLQVGAEQIYLDLQGLGPGNHALALTLKLPPGIKVLEQRPERFKVRIRILSSET